MHEFKKLKSKILTHVLLITAVGLMVGLLIQYLLIDGVLQKPFADAFVRFCERYLHMDWYGARNLYVILLRDQKPFLLTAGLLVLLIVIFYYSLSRLTQYFKETSTGIDGLLDRTKGNIRLSPELDFMEAKLNDVKDALEQRERDAREAEQRKNELVVYLAHDIRTPLTSVIGYLNLMKETPEMSAEQKANYLNITLDNTARLEQLIQEFFDITRFNLQEIKLDVTEFDLSLMLLQMADEFYPVLDSQQKKIIVHTEDCLLINGDADKLARVFRNVIKNAVTFSDRNTDIVITAVQCGENVRITFVNQGMHIPEHELNAIFDKFYRADVSRSSATGGAGLGLAIAKEIVTAHGGKTYAESSNKETIFTVLIPSTLSKS